MRSLIWQVQTTDGQEGPSRSEVNTVLDRDFVTDAIRNSTEEVFAMMLEMQPESRGITDGAPNTTGDRVIAMIGLAGPQSGTGTLTCSPALASEVSARMFMTEGQSTVVTNEVLDAIAELANMIIGNVKTALEQKLGPMAMTIPTVVYGRNFTVRNVGGVQEICMAFQMKEHEFEVHVGLAPSTAKPVAPARAAVPAGVNSLTLTPE